MWQMASKEQQVREVVEGLGLGLITLGMARVSSSKLDLESAFSHAWTRWNYADGYPSIGRAPKPDNVFWIGVTKSERRRDATVVWWREGSEYQIGVTLDGWPPDEVASLVGDRSLSHWVSLATPFRDWIEKDA